MRRMRWQDVASLVLGFFVAASPWLLGEADPTTPLIAGITAAGVLIVVVAAVDLDAPGLWEQWGLVALGVWSAVAPYVLGVPAASPLALSVTAAGLLVAALAGSVLWTQSRRTAHAH